MRLGHAATLTFLRLNKNWKISNLLTCQARQPRASQSEDQHLYYLWHRRTVHMGPLGPWRQIKKRGGGEKEEAEICISIFSLKFTSERNLLLLHMGENDRADGARSIMLMVSLHIKGNVSESKGFPEHLQVSSSESFIPHGTRIFGCLCLIICLLDFISERNIV